MKFSDRFLFYRAHILGLEGTLGREKLAKKSEVSIKTIERWESKAKDSYPNTGKLIKIINCYPGKHIDLNWLINWEGEPFPGAREDFPEVCGPPLIYNDRVQPESGRTGFEVHTPEVEYGDIKDKLIQSQEKLINQMEAQAQYQKDRITALEEKCDAFKDRLAALENKLKDNPPKEDSEAYIEKKAM